MINIISGWSNPGGSTVAFINLCNYLNDNSIPCTFYGPHEYHLNKCNGKNIKDCNLEGNIIAHYINLPKRPNCKKIVLSSHEKWWFDITKINSFWDEVIFLHKEHRDYHAGYTGNYKLIPNLKDESLVKRDKPHLDKVAGVIGTIEHRKQPHISIKRAMDDGCDKIYLYGSMPDIIYYNTYLKNLEKYFIYNGYAESKQKMYDSIGRVYHSSIGEVACLIKDECYLTGTKFFGNEETTHEVCLLSNKVILNLWKEVFDL